MTPEERAHSVFEFFLLHGWVKERDRKAVTNGIECAIRAAEQEAAARERETCGLAQHMANAIRADERNACIDTFILRLRRETQGAVSWHEVQDCIAAIRARK